MPTIEPTEEQLAEIIDGPEGPVVMVNLLRFKRDADGTMVGHESYQRYAEAVTPMLAGVGAKPVWGGRADSVFIGDSHDDWDSVLLVEYPSRQAFMQMVGSPEYLAIHHLRVEGLETSAIIATTPGAFI